MTTPCHSLVADRNGLPVSAIGRFAQTPLVAANVVCLFDLASQLIPDEQVTVIVESASESRIQTVSDGLLLLVSAESQNQSN